MYSETRSRSVDVVCPSVHQTHLETNLMISLSISHMSLRFVCLRFILIHRSPQPHENDKKSKHLEQCDRLHYPFVFPILQINISNKHQVSINWISCREFQNIFSSSLLGTSNTLVDAPLTGIVK